MTIHYHTKHFHETPYPLRTYMLLLLIDQLSMEQKYFKISDLASIGARELKSTLRTIYRDLGVLVTGKSLTQNNDGLYYISSNY